MSFCENVILSFLRDWWSILIPGSSYVMLTLMLLIELSTYIYSIFKKLLLAGVRKGRNSLLWINRLFDIPSTQHDTRKASAMLRWFGNNSHLAPIAMTNIFIHLDVALGKDNFDIVERVMSLSYPSQIWQSDDAMLVLLMNLIWQMLLIVSDINVQPFNH